MQNSQFKMTKGQAHHNLPQTKNQSSNGSVNGFNAFYYNHRVTHFQCKNKKCLSDYGRGQVDGYCQDCLQKVEFIIREKPQMLRLVGGVANAKA